MILLYKFLYWKYVTLIKIFLWNICVIHNVQNIIYIKVFINFKLEKTHK